jgi:hypothetical protein
MNPDDQAQSLYYQRIARHFLERRGAPFFLSAKDLALISAWEEAGLPLPVVLEGIDKAFENHRLRRAKADKILSLSYCSGQVSKAFEQFRDRKVGGGRTMASREDKRRRVQTEIERFLAQVPPEVLSLEDIFHEAHRKLAGPDFAEDDMEDLDEKVDGQLLARAAQDDEDKVKKDIQAEGRRLAGDELARVRDIRVVRRLRERFKIPHLSLFYY